VSFTHTLESLVQGNDLDSASARALMQFLISGSATDPQVAAVLIALRAKGVTGEELASFAGVLRGSAVGVGSGGEDLLDTCGTGGGIPSFNISSAAAFVAAAAGVRIAKHGNRAVTSACGSADVLEALGAKLTGDPEALSHMLSSVGIAFLFAPTLHPAMRNVAAVRKELGVRTVFNQLGPLANPAGAHRQIIGVYDEALLEPMGTALALLGTKRSVVVHGEDGLDEVSPCAPTWVLWVEDGQVQEGSVSPEDFGLQTLPPEALLPGATKEENAAILREALTDADSMRARAVLPSAAMAIHLWGKASLAEAAVTASEAISSGAAIRKLEAFLEATNAA
jgi:anthranilate phosphoribosyltransferase